MPLTTQPLAHSRELDAIEHDLHKNVPENERVASIVGGIALLAAAIWRRSTLSVPLLLGGVALIHRGSTGHCYLYENLGINSRQLNTEAGVPGNKGIKVRADVEINRPASEVYAFWRELENLPRFMEHIENVERIDDLRSRWRVRGPVGKSLEWTATILTDHPNELISWESLPGADVQNAGSVRFEPRKNGASTNVIVTMQYQPPAGMIGATLARLLGEAPEQQLQQDLGELKEMLEQRS